MSMSKNVSLVVASSLLLTLASCGNGHKSKSSKAAVSPVCSEINCLSSVNWKISLPGRLFPDKSRVDINGTTILNECVSKQRYNIERSAETQYLYLESFFIPKRGELKIDVVDLGVDCNSEASFISNNDVQFEVIKSSGTTEIAINL